LVRGNTMPLYRRLPRLGYAAARIVLPGGRWRYEGRGYCPSCDNRTVFVLAEGHAAWVRDLAAGWNNSAAFKAGLVTRESHICGLCGANYRMRVQARTLLDRLGLPDARALAAKLQEQPSFAIYETACRNVFRDASVPAQPHYIQSEYFADAAPGAIVDGVMNQNLEALTATPAARAGAARGSSPTSSSRPARSTASTPAVSPRSRSRASPFLEGSFEPYHWLLI
jgi:hypothetical protein